MMIKRVIQDRTVWYFLPFFLPTYLSDSVVIGSVRNLAGMMLYFSWLLLYLSISLVVGLVSGRGMFGVTLEGGGVKKDLYYLGLVSMLSSLLFTKES